jgi:excisionase family DNA binding protein
MSPERAGRYLAVSRSTIYKMLANGELRSIVYRRRRLIPKAECDAFVAREIAEQLGDDTLPAA